MSEADRPSVNVCADEVNCISNCEELAAIFRALGHPARLAIIKQLAARDEACCGEIVNHLPLAQSTVSQHLQVLKDAGLLICDTRGRNCHYLLNRDKLNRAECCSKEFWEDLGLPQAETERPVPIKTG